MQLLFGKRLIPIGVELFVVLVPITDIKTITVETYHLPRRISHDTR